MTEFSFPYTFSNSNGGAVINIDLYKRVAGSNISVKYVTDNYLPKCYYKSPDLFIDELNKITKIHGLEFKLNNNGYILCSFKPDEYDSVIVKLNANLRSIIGIDKKSFTVNEESPVFGARPFNLHATIQHELFVYTDVCEPYIVGDVHTPLLARVNIDFSKFDYWGTQSKSISNPRYIPVLFGNFRTILIDIRDRFG